MKKRIFITLTVVMLFTFVLLYGQADMDITELTRGVVKIIVGKNPVDNGTGIVIGREANGLFILTAGHVVGKAKKVKVRLGLMDEAYSPNRDKPSQILNYKSYTGRVATRKESDLDIAVITVELPLKEAHLINFPKMGRGDGTQIKPFDKVITICYFDEGIFPAENQVMRESLGKKINITRTAISPGCSGSPVFDKQENLLGIITEIDAMRAIATKIDSILEYLEKKDISTNLITNSQICYAAVNSTPSEAEIYVDNDYKGKTPGKIRLLSGNQYSLKIMKPKYSTYFGSIACNTGNVDENLTEILPPAILVRPFQSLGSDIIALKGTMLTVNETFDFSSRCSGYWICFIDDEMIWPRIEISEAAFKKTVAVPSSGFNGGKLVLVCVVGEVSRQFRNWLESGSDNPLLKPDKYNIILQANIKIGGAE